MLLTINKQDDTWTINSTGSSYTNTDGNIEIKNNSNTINLENSIETQTATFTNLNIPDNTLSKSTKKDSNTSLDKLSSNKLNNITLNAGDNIAINKQNDTWTISSTGGSNLTGTSNISVYNNSIDLEKYISITNLSAEVIT